MAFDEARRDEINRIYYEKLGRTDPDQEGLDYWMGRDDLSLDQLQRAIVANSPMADKLGVEDGGNLNAALLADQGYSAFLRNMNFDESQIQSSLMAAKRAAEARITGAKAGYNRQREQGTRGIQNSYEQRQNRAGKRLVDIGRNTADITRQQNTFETGINDAKAEMVRNSAQAIAKGRRNNVEEQMAARDRLTQRSVDL